MQTPPSCWMLKNQGCWKKRLFPLPEVRLGSCPRAGGAIVGGAGQVPCIPFGLSLEEVVMRLPPAELPVLQVVSKVAGYDNTVSNLYDSITTENVEEIFQNKLEHLGTEIYGEKRLLISMTTEVVQVVFLTETEKDAPPPSFGNDYRRGERKISLRSGNTITI